MSEYNCSNCDYKSKTKWNVQSHINKVCKEATLEENIIKVECDICGKMFDTIKLLTQHKQKCFEKRTVVIPEFLNPKKIEETMEGMMLLIASLQNDTKTLMKTTEEQAKRIEKLEENHKITKDARKKGFEILTDEQVEEENSECGRTYIESKKVVKYEELLDILNKKDFIQASTKARVTIIDKSGKVIQRCIAGESGVSTSIDGKEIKYDFTNINIVTSMKICKNQIYSRILKTGLCYCREHLDTETGLPKD